MSKPTIIATLGFKARGQVKGLRDLLKYLQYRDGSLRREAFLREGSYPDQPDSPAVAHRERRWVDRGLGETYKEIANQAFDWQGRKTLARTWVISPDPELMQHVPEAQRFDLVSRVTERTLERWYSENGWGQPEYSYVIHDKQRAADGMQMVHAHVITPGTVRVDEAGELGRVDHYVSRVHIRDLHRTTAESFELELGRVLGKDRARQIIRERDERLAHERGPRRSQRERSSKLRALGDIMELLEAEKQARQKGKQKQRQRRSSRQVQAELRMYSRYVSEERSQRREADRRRVEIARADQQDSELRGERRRHRTRVEQITEKGQRIPTHAESLEQDERDRQALQLYYAQLFQGQPDRDRDNQEIERE